MSFQASTRNFLHRGLRQCFVHLSGRTSGHKWWIPLWQFCFFVEQRISFKQAFDPNTPLPIYGFTFPPFCEAKIHWKNLNPSNSKASPTVTDQPNSPILTLKMKVDGRWLSFSKGLFFSGCRVAFIFRLHKRNFKVLERPAASTSHCWHCSSPRHGVVPNHTDPIYPREKSPTWKKAILAGGFHPSEKYVQVKLNHLPGQKSKMIETIT